MPQVIKDLRLLPLLAGETVEQKVAAFRNYDDVVSLSLCWCVFVHVQFEAAHFRRAPGAMATSFIIR